MLETLAGEKVEIDAENPQQRFENTDDLKDDIEHGFEVGRLGGVLDGSLVLLGELGELLQLLLCKSTEGLGFPLVALGIVELVP